MDLQEKYITLAQAAKRTPGRPHPSAIWRWCRDGILARSGTRIRLEHVRIGKRLFTTENWLANFFRCLAEEDLWHFKERRQAAIAPPRPRYRGRTEEERRRAVAEAMASLKAEGL